MDGEYLRVPTLPCVCVCVCVYDTAERADEIEQTVVRPHKLGRYPDLHGLLKGVWE